MDNFQYRRLLVPLDGSQRAGSVLALASAIARAHKAELSLVHIVGKPEMARHMPRSQEDTELSNRLIDVNQEAGNKYMELILPHLPENTRARVLVSENIAVTLQDISEQEQIDLLILSAHGYSGEVKWSYGSITNRFITDGTTPLLIVQDLPQESSASSYTGVETRQPLRQTNDI
jgi:nucleotide-binding universal stress UspA family protein